MLKQTWLIFLVQKDSNNLSKKPKVTKRDNNTDFHLVPNLTKEEADLNRFIRLRNQLVIAAENFGREENFSPVLIPSMSKFMDEQLKLAQKVIDVMDQQIERFVWLCCGTMWESQRVHMLKSD